EQLEEGVGRLVPHPVGVGENADGVASLTRNETDLVPNLVHLLDPVLRLLVRRPLLVELGDTTIIDRAVGILVLALDAIGVVVWLRVVLVELRVWEVETDVRVEAAGGLGAGGAPAAGGVGRGVIASPLAPEG